MESLSKHPDLGVWVFQAPPKGISVTPCYLSLDGALDTLSWLTVTPCWTVRGAQNGCSALAVHTASVAKSQICLQRWGRSQRGDNSLGWARGCWGRQRTEVINPALLKFRLPHSKPRTGEVKVVCAASKDHTGWGGVCNHSARRSQEFLGNSADEVVTLMVQ